MSLNSSFNKIAVIVAGGMGIRMGAAQPKQFLELNGRSILARTVETFLSSYSDMKIVLVLPALHLQAGMKLIGELNTTRLIDFVEGGETRFHSVQNGLSYVPEGSIVFVQDAVRCLLSVDLIHRCFDQAVKLGSAIPAIGSKDSVRILQNGQSHSMPRDRVRLIQTPQTFRSDILLSAYKTAYRPEFTDEASVVEAQGGNVELIDGEERNIKITCPEDLILATHYLKQSFT